MESAGQVSAMEQERSGFRGGTKAVIFLGVLFGVLVLDISTKLLVQKYFFLYQQTEIIGDYVRFTYIYNPGAAFGIHLGENSRVIFLVLSLLALGALVAMYWFTPVADRIRLIAIALICGGALGNLIDRVRSAQGVVDFIDVGIGTIRWPVFNIADIAVTTGAIVLALSLWKEEQQVEQR
jgi:signal peptidase II